MKNKTSMICLIIVMLISLITNISAAENPEAQGRLIAAIPLTPPHLDTDKTTDSNVGSIMFHVYEGLFEIDENYNPIPHLAASYEVEERGLYYHFHLRQGVLFHNGQEMNAEDAYASFNRYLKNNGGGRNIAPYVEQVEITGEYSFSVLFAEPYAPFLYFLASPVANQKFVIRPASLIEKYEDNVMEEHIGTGPFQFLEWVPDQYILLERFDNYQSLDTPYFGYSGQKQVYIEQLQYRIVPEQSIRISGVQTGEYHFAEAAPRDQLPLFERNPRLQTFIVSPYRQSFIIINMGNPPFDNIYARQALQYAIDIEEMGLIVIGDTDFWTLNPSLFPAGHIWHVADAGAGIYNNYDPEQAQKLLSLADYQGEKIIVLNSREDNIENTSAIVLKSQLEKVGFNVEIQLYDRATVVERRAQPQGFHLHFSQFFSPDPDPQVYGAWMGTNRWIGRWDDEKSREMDQIFAAMLVETDYEKRYEIVEDWHQAFYEYVPYIKLYDFKQLRLAHHSLQNFSSFPFPTFFNVWID